MRVSIILSITLIVLKLFISSAIALDYVKETLNCIHKKSWQECERITKSSKDRVLNKIVLSQKFLDSNHKKNSFEQIIQFIQENPNWPEVDILKEKAEQYLNYNTKPMIIVDWFSKNQPLTAIGYKFYALASKNMIKDQKKLKKIIKNGWIYGKFTKDEECQYLSDFKEILWEKDHIKKIDQYLWEKDIESANRYMHYVSNGYKQNFKAQIAILNKSYNSEQLFQSVSEKYYTPALLFYYLDTKKTEVPTNKAIELFKKIKPNKMYSSKWARLQSYYAREFIDHKDFANSYKVISIPLTVNHEDVREAEWLSGWLALRFLHKPDVALQHFNKFIKIAKKPLSVSRGQYWLARTYEAKGDRKHANKLYHMASKYPHTFYGQLAHIELNKQHLVLPKQPLTTKYNKNHQVVTAIKYFVKHNNHDLALLYAKSAIEKSHDQSEILFIANLISGNCDISKTLAIAKIACQQHACVKNLLFPTPYIRVVKNAPMEPALTYSIMRQESAFNQNTVSIANAKGLMQILERDVCKVAQAAGVKCFVEKLTTDHKYNITLGTDHFNKIVQLYNGSYLLGIPAYNAGPGKVKRWLGLFGDPRKLKNLWQIIDWIELIPYAETRNYTQRVLENLQVYRSVLNKDSRLKLKQDLLD